MSLKLRSVTSNIDPPWQHDWQTVARWNRSRARWEARMRPGLVNALPATVAMVREDYPRATLQRHRYLGTEPPESADVPLTDDPWFPLTTFRAMGSDGTPAGHTDGVLQFEAVPEFFRIRGVGVPPAVDLNDLGAINVEAPTNARLLRACDLVLQVDRPATATQWTIDASGLGSTVAQFALTTVTKPRARKSAYLRTFAQWQPPQAQGDLLAGDVADSTTDEYLVATVFLVSQRGAPLGSTPDGTWSAATQQHGAFFWNMNHSISKPRQLAESQLSLVTGLAGGVGDTVNAFILAQRNDRDSAAAKFLAGGRLETQLWTA